MNDETKSKGQENEVQEEVELDESLDENNEDEGQNEDDYEIVLDDEQVR